MTNYAAGHAAELGAADYLKKNGFKIVHINWKTRYCEIDIVAQKDKTIYFFEVKSRKNTLYGSGFEYITPRKLKRMSFAAEMWVKDNNWSGPYQMSVISIDNNEISLLEDL